METELTKKLISICATNAQLENDLSLTLFGIDNLTKEQRIQVEAELIKHFDFERIVWIEFPVVFVEEQKTVIATEAYKTSNDDPKHTGKVGYVYKVFFTQKKYDLKLLYKPVKVGCVFAPITYNPETLQPMQSITLTWSPEFSQEINVTERIDEYDKQFIRDMLEKVLDNPKEYRPEGYRECIVRFATI